MHIELVDSLRCPHPHEDIWLVASVHRFDGRDIVEGTLGCPVCRRQYAVEGGEVDFSTGSVTGTDRRTADAGNDTAPDGRVDPDDVLRARALLSLGDGGGIVLLGGTHARLEAALADQAQVMPLLLNPPRWVRAGGRVPSAVRAGDGLPLARGVLRAAWLDADTATPSLLAGAVRALRPGGRLVAPVAIGVPEEVTELARDTWEWVAESHASSGGATSEPVPLSVRRRPSP